MIGVFNPRIVAASLGAVLALVAGISLGSYLKFDAADIKTTSGPHLRVRPGQ